MDLLQGTARKQGGRVDKGRRFFSSRVKERILSAAGYRLRYGLREEGVADDDHRSFSSTIVDGSSIDENERTHGRSRHCAISNANIKSDLILDKFNNSLPPNSSRSNQILENSSPRPPERMLIKFIDK